MMTVYFHWVFNTIVHLACVQQYSTIHFMMAHLVVSNAISRVFSGFVNEQMDLQTGNLNKWIIWVTVKSMSGLMVRIRQELPCSCIVKFCINMCQSGDSSQNTLTKYLGMLAFKCKITCSLIPANRSVWIRHGSSVSSHSSSA